MGSELHSVIFDPNAQDLRTPTQLNFFSTDYSSEAQTPQNTAYSSYSSAKTFTPANFEDEPPLLEELGINFSHIRNKSFAVLNPVSKISPHIMDDTDLAGPLFFGLMLGCFLLFTGKVHFGYIYGLGVVGSLGMHIILNLMSTTSIDFNRTISVLGYCLLPMVLLAFLSLLLPMNGMLGLLLSGVIIIWCTHSASAMFVTVLCMKDQFTLIAYPIGLLYAGFGLLTVF